MKKTQIVNSIVTGLCLAAVCNMAMAAEYIPFRQRHPRLIIPKYEEAQVTIKEDGPKLVFSDSPEMVKDCGVTYRDTISGRIRLFFHHVNDTKTDKRLAVVLKNTSFRPAYVKLGASGISKPRKEEDWLLAGKEAQKEYFHNELKGKEEVIKVERFTELLTGDKGRRFKPNELITGIVDFETSKPIEVSFLMIPVHTDFKLALEMYQPLAPDPGDNILRGTFPTSDCHVTLTKPFNTDGDKIVGITLADNVKNPYVKGVDALTGRRVVNYGNYGVFYDVTIPTVGKGEAVINFSPEGGTYAGFGTLGEKNKKGKQVKTKMIAIPSHSVSFGKNGADDAITIGKIDGKKTGEVVFSPPGSSNLPIKLILIPEKHLKK